MAPTLTLKSHAAIINSLQKYRPLRLVDAHQLVARVAKAQGRRNSARFITTAASRNDVSIPIANTIGGYIKEKELNILCDVSTKSVAECLAKLAKNLTVKFDYTETPTYTESQGVDELGLSAPRYPKVSFFADGVINVSLANKSVYTDFIRDARQYRLEEMALNKRYNHKRHTEPEMIKMQYTLDGELPKLIKTAHPLVLIEMLKNIHLLKLSVRSGNLVQLCNRAIKVVGSLEPSKLVELALILHDIGDVNCRFLSLAIAVKLEEWVNSNLNEANCSSVVDMLAPLALVHHSKNGLAWSVLSNSLLLQSISAALLTLPFETRTKAISILAGSGNLSIIPSEHLDSFTSELASCDEKEVLTPLLFLCDAFVDFPRIRHAIFNRVLSLKPSVPPRFMASVFLKLNASDPLEICEGFKNAVQKRLKELEGNMLANVYCNMLTNANKTRRDEKTLEWAVRYKSGALSMRDVSNMLMYSSMHTLHGKFAFPILMQRFAQLKQRSNLKYDEVLDAVLSMSLLGLHKAKVWQGIDLAHMTYSTPINILVYLGFAFLITNERSKANWKVLVERLLYECKHHTAEVYAVLKSAQVLEFFKFETDSPVNKKMEHVLSTCKSLHFAKLARQRHKCPAPIEHVLHLLGLQYQRDKLIHDLYEVSYFIPKHKMAIEITRDPIHHKITKGEVGEPQLRHAVLKKLGVKVFNFHDATWDKFREENPDKNTLGWKIEEMTAFVARTIKMPHLFRFGDNVASPILKTRLSKSRPRLSNNRLNVNTSHAQRIKRLQKLVIDHTTTTSSN